MRRSLLFLLMAGWSLAGCARVHFMAAEKQEKSGRYEQALKAYMRFAERHPEHALAPEALLAAGTLASRTLSDHELSRRLLQSVIDRYGDRKDFGRRAERELFNTPNYFPLVEHGQWEEGDSETGGKNALVKITCRPAEEDPSALSAAPSQSEGTHDAPGARGELRGQSAARRADHPSGALFSRSYYAGTRFVKELSANRIYRKQNLELREYDEKQNGFSVILKHPLEKGTRWTVQRAGKTYAYTIEGTTSVHVTAGAFKDCLVVREQQEGIETSWKKDYYAPGVGKVLTTLATPATEKRNTELLSYDLSNGKEIGGEAP
ncbi:MAG: tetratricopeptide repeat protein [Elusimicrobia bacterium]|nr:tetratricopeptide repeat protein [Elusimicrobiota bacterium]